MRFRCSAGLVLCSSGFGRSFHKDFRELAFRRLLEICSITCKALHGGGTRFRPRATRTTGTVHCIFRWLFPTLRLLVQGAAIDVLVQTCATSRDPKLVRLSTFWAGRWASADLTSLHKLQLN